MLLLVGIGTKNEELSLEALECIKNSKKVFLDSYTSIIEDERKEFLQRIRKDIEYADRDLLESGSKRLIDLAREEDVCILVSGDPLIATTHISLLEECHKKNVKFKIVHAPSIISIAMGESGLDPYRFGGVVTVPKWKEKQMPKSFMERIYANLSINLHTILLLDISEGYMGVEEAIRVLKECDYEKRLNNAILISIGKEKVQMFGSLDYLLTHFDKFERKMYVLIVPSKLSFFEEEHLRLLATNTS
ncbi:MAG: diphthine synthase [Candidatus Micrarchaeaceae archaeon]